MLRIIQGSNVLLLLMYINCKMTFFQLLNTKNVCFLYISHFRYMMSLFNNNDYFLTKLKFFFLTFL